MRWKIGVLGLIHDHVWQHIPELARRDDVTLSVADPNPPLLEQVRASYGVERLYGDYADLLAREQPDAVLIFVDNAGKAELVELAAGYGLPIMLEKPMADCLASAERIRVAANAAGVPLMVNWPNAWNPELRLAIDLARAGEIGDIYRISARLGHAGPKEYGCSPYFWGWLYDRARNGGGAYIDYCGYGASIARVVLGMPSRVHATIGRLQKDYVAVDDNAVLTLRYPNAMAVFDATWTANGPVPDGGPLFMGRGGTLVVRGKKALREGEVAQRGGVERIDAEHPDGVLLPTRPLPAGEDSATSYFLTRLRADQPFDGLVSWQVGLDTQQILEAGLQAEETGTEVSLPLRGA
ncbi:MAG: gfo/Idh/MocA family oxidoreductase [Chloroflexi bacterium]|nr:MAG: gfo/Idh/MocA family oxidoreductase [Chloroflexota bacterium]